MKDVCEHVLGPEKRFVLWFFGCDKNCPGCIFHEKDDGEYKEATVENIVGEIISTKGLEGITLSGGEPFKQKDALLELVTHIKEKSHLGIIVYSGLTYEELLIDETSKKILDNIDLLIDGEYKIELDIDNNLKGSSNQRAIPLSDRYRYCLDWYKQRGKRSTVINVTDNEIHSMGIPTKEVSIIVQALKEKNEGKEKDKKSEQIIRRSFYDNKRVYKKKR